MVLKCTHLHPLSNPPFSGLRFCSGKYNQSISHWQIPIICNFMDDKPIWNQNDPLNACSSPNELIMIFFSMIFFSFLYYLLSWNPEDRFLFLKWNWSLKWEEKCQCVREQDGRKRNVALWQRHFVWGRGFWHTSHSAAQICPNIPTVSNCSSNCNLALRAIFNHARDNRDNKA